MKLSTRGTEARASQQGPQRLWPSALALFLLLAPLLGPFGPSALAQGSKSAGKTKAAKLIAPPLPTPSPRRVADTPLAKSDTPSPPGESSVRTAVRLAEAAAHLPEASFFADMDRLIAPLRESTIQPSEAQQLREALKAVDTNNPAQAQELAAKLREPVLRTLVTWYALRRGVGSIAEYDRFLADNGAWPDGNLLRRRQEQQLLSTGGSAREIRALFDKRPPLSGAGRIALASAYLALGDEARAKDIAVAAWRENEVSSAAEKGFLARFGHFLTPADHQRRLDGLLIDDGRFARHRAPRVAAARRLLSLLEEGPRAIAKARIAVYARAKNAAKLMSALPAQGKDQAADPGLLFQRIQLARSQSKHDEVARLLRRAPADADALVDPDAWWQHRQWAIYHYLGAGRFKEAYDVARAPGPLTANPIKDATFLAGWIALRHLKTPKASIPHLQASRENADGPLSAARGSYWLARAHEALGQQSEARRYYEEAGARIDTFHGALARQKLNPGPQEAPIPLPALPSAETAKNFAENALVRAAVLAHQANVGRGITRIIVAHLRSRLESEGEVALLAHLAMALGDHQMAVRVGKTGIARGMNLYVYSYPVHPFPTYTPLRKSPERALLLAIARQESEFNAQIVSHAGARGLLQVMPITARHICRDHKISCDIPRLVTDTSYNAMIASAYIGDRKREFSGSYVLTLAGYNAGPGRARQWMRRFGDPRTKDIDPIDWIEMIPFTETREYVKKVLSNLQMYRARLGEPQPVRLVSDLKR